MLKKVNSETHLTSGVEGFYLSLRPWSLTKSVTPLIVKPDEVRELIQMFPTKLPIQKHADLLLSVDHQGVTPP